MSEHPIDAELIPPETSQALTLRPTQEVAPGLFGVHDPAAVLGKAEALARVLKDVIVRQGLVSKISGKEYPRCEAWTLLGTMLGVFPVLVWSKPVEGGWEARVEARTKDGAVIGAAEAQCLKSEKNWSNRDDFALRSMAQTRATAKCLRMPLGFVMNLSGFEVTPAEEMVSDHPHKPAPGSRQSQKTPPATPDASKNAPTVTHTPKKGIPVPFPTPESRQKMIAALKAGPGEPNREIVCEYFQKLENPSALMPNEPLEELDLRFVPATVKQMTALASKLAEFGNGERAGWAFPPHPEPEAPKEATPETVDHSDMEQVTGTIQHVSQKQGTSKKGPWVLYGIKICDGWINTFSDRVGALAQQNQGKKVTVWYKTEEKGRTAYDLEVVP